MNREEECSREVGHQNKMVDITTLLFLGVNISEILMIRLVSVSVHGSVGIKY